MTRRILATVALIVVSLFATPRAAHQIDSDGSRPLTALVIGIGRESTSAGGQLGAPHDPVTARSHGSGAPSSEPAGRTVTTERLNPMPATRSGIWSYADPSHGPLYLAIPEGRGWRVTVCGPLACLERTSTDAGPDLFLQRKGRIGDLSWRDFLAVCGPLSRGICDGSYAIGGRALPETSTGGER
jgi:hypothetical protein